LKRLSNGLVVVRRKKHEWRDELDRMDVREFARATDRINGSKFSREWTLEQYIGWLEAEVSRIGWTRDTPSTDVEVVLPTAVGWSHGRRVSKIRIELGSGFIHAYPI
jgi:hypothetical protein